MEGPSPSYSDWDRSWGFCKSVEYYEIEARKLKVLDRTRIYARQHFFLPENVDVLPPSYSEILATPLILNVLSKNVCCEFYSVNNYWYVQNF